MANSSASRKPVKVDPAALALRLGRAIRKARGQVTQVQLATRSGIDQASISLIERGERLPTIEQVARIEAALQLARGALFEAGYSQASHSTRDAIANVAALPPVARETLLRVYDGLLEMPAQ